jgi:hypothetical protein
VAPESIYLYFIEGAGDLIETLPLPLTVDFGADFLVIMGWDIPSVAVVCQSILRITPEPNSSEPPGSLFPEGTFARGLSAHFLLLER